MMDCGFCKDGNWFRYRAAAIIIEDGCVLAAKNDRFSYYYSVGGAVEHFETSANAVEREVFEETGVHYEVDRLKFIHENFFGEQEDKGERCHEVTFYYLMKPRGSKELHDDGYCLDGVREHMVWIPIEKYAEYDAYPRFFAEKLKDLSGGIEHIITRE